MDANSWIADGTKEAEPVTSETPANTEGLPGGTEAVADEGVAGASTSEGGQPRDEHGRFASATAVETPVAEATPAQQAAIEAFIEGKLGDQPFKLPEGVLLPLKRGDEIAYEPITEILRSGMRERDYRLNNQTLKEQRSAFEAERSRHAAEQARLEARAKYVEEQEAELRAAQTDPNKWAAYQEHIRQYQVNPIYRKNVDAALDQRETAAELAAYQQEADQRVVEQASETAKGWIENIAEEFPDVDPNRVAQIYGQRLSAGSARLAPTDVRAIYQAEADYLRVSVTPLQQQLADLTAQVQALKAGAAAETHNKTTQHAVQRAKTVPVATGVGAPTKVAVPPTKFGPNELAERNAQWARGG